jgi:two-component system response regulator AlgR
MKLRVLIVDDEPLARARLRTLLADCLDPAAEVVGEAGHAGAALEWLSRHSADVLLLDIHMPGLDGLALARRLRQQPRCPAVVFVTAYAEHAVDAFEVEAVDYLTKPVRRLRLQQALARAAQRLAANAPAAPPPSGWAPTGAAAFAPTQPAVWPTTQPGAFAATQPAAWPATRPASLSPAAPAADDAALVVHERQGLVRVPLSQVLYLKAELKYITVRTAQTSHLIEASLTDLETRLGARFLRIHRNAIVARHAIRELRRHGPGTGFGGLDGQESGEGWSVCVEPLGEWLAVSRRQLAAVREALAGQGL